MRNVPGTGFVFLLGIGLSLIALSLLARLLVGGFPGAAVGALLSVPAAIGSVILPVTATRLDLSTPIG